MFKRFTATPFIWLLTMQAVNAASINVIATDRTEVTVNINHTGTRKLSLGESSPEGVKLVDIGRDGIAVFSSNGKTIRLDAGQTVEPVVKLTADRQGHFVTSAWINGISRQVIVDTGATLVVLSVSEARILDIDYRRGKQISANTANGRVEGYAVELDSVRVGDIDLFKVPAFVLDSREELGAILLGASFLNQLDYRHSGNVLELRYR